MPEKITRRAVLIAGAAGLLASQVQPNGAQASDGKDIPTSLNTGFTNLDHEHFMRLAIDQAKKVPKFPFGSVIVNLETKEVISEGWVKLDNPIWHGEMTAIAGCPPGTNWQQVGLYTTGESCPMCQSAIVWSKMPLVVYGSSIPFLQTCGYSAINIRSKTIIDAALNDYKGCKSIGGVLEIECNRLFEQAAAMGGGDF
jgi:Cytosine/adenosine deaminases